MGSSKNLARATLALLILTLILFWIGFSTNTGFWAFDSAKTLGLISGLALTIIVLIVAMLFRKLEDTSTPEDDRTKESSGGALSYAIAALVVLIPLLFPSAGFFWKNITNGPMGLFGKLSQLLANYAVLPAAHSVVDLWNQTFLQRAIAIVCAGLYGLLSVAFVSSTSLRREGKLLATALLVTSGTVAIFAVGGDFAVITMLLMACVYFGSLYLNSRCPAWLIGVVMIVTAVYAPVTLPVVLAMAGATVIRKLRSTPIALAAVLILAAISAGLTLAEFSPFVTIFKRSLVMPSLITAEHFSGILQQFLMVSHFVVPLAFVVSILYMFGSRQNVGLTFLSLWVILSSVYYLSAHSVYGQILGFPSISLVLVPSLAMIVVYVSERASSTATRTLAFLLCGNIVATTALICTINDRTAGTDAYADTISKEVSMDPRFEEGKIGMMVGVMLSEHFKDYNNALPFLNAYADRYRLELPGRYYRGWAMSNATGVDSPLSHAVEDYKYVDKELELENKGFWELYFRLGQIFFNGKNPTFAAIYFEKAAADSVTSGIATILGSLYDGLKVNDSIISKYQQALALGADTIPILYYRMGYAAARLGDSTEGVNFFKQGIYQFPKWVDNYEFPAQQYYNHNELDSLESLVRIALKNNTRSPQLEARMIMAFDKEGRNQERDSAVVAFANYFQMMPGVLNEWGTFLENEGLRYEGRKIQALDMTTEDNALGAVLAYFYYYKAWNMPDSARRYIEEYYKYTDSEDVRNLLERLIENNPDIWPEPLKLPDTVYHID